MFNEIVSPNCGLIHSESKDSSVFGHLSTDECAHKSSFEIVIGLAGRASLASCRIFLALIFHDFLGDCILNELLV